MTAAQLAAEIQANPLERERLASIPRVSSPIQRSPRLPRRLPLKEATIQLMHELLAKKAKEMRALLLDQEEMKDWTLQVLTAPGRSGLIARRFACLPRLSEIEGDDAMRIHAGSTGKYCDGMSRRSLPLRSTRC